MPEAARRTTAAHPAIAWKGGPNLRHLRAFAAVANSGSISAAAGKLYRAQSVITRSILELEGDLGVPLFERRPSGMRLTVFGEALAARARIAAAEFERARTDLQRTIGKNAFNGAAPIFSMQVGNRKLAAFLCLIDLHNMPDVARRIGVTQPAVSAAIRELEESLLTPLFQRTPRGLLPTPAAEVLAMRLKLAQSELRIAGEEIGALRGVRRGHVHVGALALSRTAIIVPRAVARLIQRHPSVRVSVLEGAFATQEIALRSGELDLIFGALHDFQPGSELIGEPLLEDKLCITVRADHPLTRRKRLSLRALQNGRWILNRSGTPGRERLEAAFHARRIAPPTVSVETGSLAMTRALLLESECVTALSPYQIEHELKAGTLRILPVDIPETRRPIGIMKRKGSIPSPSTQLLIDAIREVVAEIDSTSA